MSKKTSTRLLLVFNILVSAAATYVLANIACDAFVNEQSQTAIWATGAAFIGIINISVSVSLLVCSFMLRRCVERLYKD